MAQTASVPAPAAPPARALPLESFLATDDPVWVWDGQGRRIVWANAAATKLWGDATPERLKRRRAGKTTAAPARLTAMARSGEALGDHVETLRIPTPDGDVAVPCVFQRLQLAGGRPGLVVRAVTERDNAEQPAEIAIHPAAETVEAARPQPASTPRQLAKKARKTASRSDIGALKAIARDLGDAKSRAQASSAKAAQSASKPARKPAKPATSRKPAPKPRKTGKRVPEPTAPSSEEMIALLARVSHEIRNPLTIILGFAEILQSDRADRLPPGKAKEYASDIHRTAQLALGLADDLLGFAERASGEPPPHDWFDLNALIADCLHLLEPVAAAQGVTLIRRLKRDAPLLLAHERSVRQILLNLLMNALRHGDGGEKIRVMTRLDREGGLILSVKDDGPGMTPEQIAAAKTPEQAGDVKAAGRRGLGLRLVLGFVVDNQGELDIISKPGEGTDIRIRFGPDRLRAPKPQKPKRKPQKRKRK
jgi:two-component sensor histidine kinase